MYIAFQFTLLSETDQYPDNTPGHLHLAKLDCHADHKLDNNYPNLHWDQNHTESDSAAHSDLGKAGKLVDYEYHE